MVPHLAGNSGAFLQLAGCAQGFFGVQGKIWRAGRRLMPESENKAPELPLYTLDVQAMDLGAEIKAVGMELLETESREPVRGKEAATVWGAALPALAAKETLVMDFFSHLERVEEYCKTHELAYRQAAHRCMVITPSSPEDMTHMFERFEKETFGVR